MTALYDGGLASPAAISSTLLTRRRCCWWRSGRACACGGVFNLGQEGQVLIGALAGAGVGLRLALPGPVLLVVALLAAALAGGAWAGISSLMHRFRGVNIVVSTLLMTFLAQQMVSFAVNTPWLLQETRRGNATVSRSPTGCRRAGCSARSASTRTCRSTAGCCSRSSRPW